MLFCSQFDKKQLDLEKELQKVKFCFTLREESAYKKAWHANIEILIKKSSKMRNIRVYINILFLLAKSTKVAKNIQSAKKKPVKFDRQNI